MRENLPTFMSRRRGHFNRFFFALLILQLLLPIAFVDRALGGLQPLRLAASISSHMVIQRHKPFVVSGLAGARTEVHLALGDLRLTVTANDQGLFVATIPPMEAGGPLQLQVSTKDERRTFDQVMVGDVWLAAGQSNMEWPLYKTAGQPSRRVHSPNIRIFKVKRQAASVPIFPLELASDLNGLGWYPATQDYAEALAATSGVAYFFAEMVERHLQIPIGIVVSAYGGTPIETWLPATEMPNGRPCTLAPNSVFCSYGPNQYPTEPNVVYNAMINPLGDRAFAGVLWYQGESNVGHHREYASHFTKLASSWRRHFKESSLPFYTVQLAPFRYGDDPTLLPKFWDTQYGLAQSVPQSGIVTSIDVGQFNDIHPTNKQAIGERLGRLALAKHYQRTDIVASGPKPEGPKSLTLTNQTVVVTYPNSPSGLLEYPPENRVQGFEVAGEGGVYEKVTAWVGAPNQVHLSVPPGKTTLRVRYGWHQTPEVNLRNQSGLPAEPWGEKVVIGRLH